eukprot:COSAG01_NODE_15_length_40797_cov_245.690550_18_plen_92_part_00
MAAAAAAAEAAQAQVPAQQLAERLERAYQAATEAERVAGAQQVAERLEHLRTKIGHIKATKTALVAEGLDANAIDAEIEELEHQVLALLCN